MTRSRITDTKDLRAGQKISFTCNGRGRGGHYGVTAVVTKVNHKTVKAVEDERSYRAGTLWNISVSEDNPVYKEETQWNLRCLRDFVRT